MSIKLSDYSTKAPEGFKKKPTKKKLDELTKLIAEKQHLLYAEKKKSLLVIFQGMDSSGKDGATKNVFKDCSLIGTSAYSFKKPTELEFAHDFLWRVHKLTPAKGEIVIFNRSHYEDILIQRVHGWVDEDRVNARINAINSFEKLLIEDNDTTILKFFMNISEERQLEKLQERIDLPHKNWKHNDGDWEERKHWDAYMDAYENAINKCNEVPWIIVPVDSRWYRNYFIAEKILETLNKMEFTLPIIKKPE